MHNRKSLIVYFKSPRVIKRLKKHGNVPYYHKKRKYAILYINEDRYDEVMKDLKRLNHVRRVEESLLDDEAYRLSEDKNETEEEQPAQDVSSKKA